VSADRPADEPAPAPDDRSEPPPSGIDPARALLGQLRADARALGRRAAERRAQRGARSGGPDVGPRSGAEPDDRDPQPLAPEVGPEKPPQVAWIDEARCIGCARCIPACPVDAIVGAQKFTHTVIAAHCTGCELCLPPCPVDCIELRVVDADAERLHRAA